MRGKDARVKFVDSHLKKGIAFQVQALRGREKWTQEQLAAKLGSNQNAVYRLENPNYGKQTITTLKKVAAVFDVALVVRLVPFSQLVDWVSRTPHLDPGLTPNALEVPDFETEVEMGVLEAHAQSPSRNNVIDAKIIYTASEALRENVRCTVAEAILSLATPTGPAENSTQFTWAGGSPAVREHLQGRADFMKIELSPATPTTGQEPSHIVIGGEVIPIDVAQKASMQLPNTPQISVSQQVAG
jgi:transcriptional regulator with XRE-family HTH domain